MKNVATYVRLSTQPQDFGEFHWRAQKVVVTALLVLFAPTTYLRQSWVASCERRAQFAILALTHITFAMKRPCGKVGERGGKHQDMIFAYDGGADLSGKQRDD